MRLNSACTAALLGLFSLSGSQSPASAPYRADDQQNPVVFKSAATLVQVPAVVTDKTGKHIHGLNKSDFHVFENGTEQKIDIFEEIATGRSRPSVAPKLPNTFTNLAPSSDALILVFDAINTNFNDQNSGREYLIKYLTETKDVRRPIALFVMSDTGVKKLSGVTDDPAIVIAILKNTKAETPATEAFAVSSQTFSSAPERLKLQKEADLTEATSRQEQAIDRTMRAFLAIAWSLSGVPGRKSVIWATGGFPFYLEGSFSEPENPRLALLYERTMEALNDAQISVYPVDARGLTSTSSVKDSSERDLSGEERLNKTVARNQLLDSTLHNLRSFAEMTGGRAFYNRNDLDTGFREAVNDSSSYYLIGYYRNSQNKKPGWRKLQVTVQREESEVRARSGFYVGHTTLNPESTQQADEAFALLSPFDSTGIPLLIRWNLPSADPSGHAHNPEFAMIVPAANVVEASDTHRVNVDFIWEASKNGSSVVKDGHTVKGAVSGDDLAKLIRDGVFYKNALKLPAGDYQVKFVVRDNLSGRIGSVTAPLTVK